MRFILEQWDDRTQAWLKAGEFDTKGAARARAFELRIPGFRVREVPPEAAASPARA